MSNALGSHSPKNPNQFSTRYSPSGSVVVTAAPVWYEFERQNSGWPLTAQADSPSRTFLICFKRAYSLKPDCNSTPPTVTETRDMMLFISESLTAPEPATASFTAKENLRMSTKALVGNSKRTISFVD